MYKKINIVPLIFSTIACNFWAWHSLFMHLINFMYHCCTKQSLALVRQLLILLWLQQRHMLFSQKWWWLLNHQRRIMELHDKQGQRNAIRIYYKFSSLQITTFAYVLFLFHHNTHNLNCRHNYFEIMTSLSHFTNIHFFLLCTLTYNTSDSASRSNGVIKSFWRYFIWKILISNRKFLITCK